jgi:MoxR-like ATPase
MPADITGTEVIQEDRATGSRSFKFLRGPVFANVVLADEINRTPPKTQAALLEAMQERQVTIGGQRHPLIPFFFLATQNPIEQEWHLPTAEARELMSRSFAGPQHEGELAIAELAALDHRLSRDAIRRARCRASA